MVMDQYERLSDVLKLSAHVTRVLGQNPGQMTLQGTNSFLLQPPSNPHAPLILVDTSSPHTAQQYVDLLFLHLHHLGLESGIRETHFESAAAQMTLRNFKEENRENVQKIVKEQRDFDPWRDHTGLVEYGPGSSWVKDFDGKSHERKLPVVEHIVLTHRHLDHVGALPLLLKTLKEHGCPPPKLWKFPSPDEAELNASDRDRPSSDSSIWQSLPPGTYTPLSPFQPFHPILPGLMISIIDPRYRSLLKYDKDGRAKWNEVPEIARVSVRCLRTPGHTADSVSLVLMEGEKGVFTGDTVLGHGTTQFNDLSSYMTSLRTLLALKPKVLYPAHGNHLIGPKKCLEHIQTYIAHRQTREDEIATLLQRFSKGKEESLAEALLEMKKQLHEKKEADNKEKGPLMLDRKKAVPLPSFDEERRRLESLARLDGVLPMSIITRLLYKSENERLLFAASKNVNAHLEKLIKEEKVKKGQVTVVRLVEGNVEEEKEDTDGWEWVGAM
ncbi:hypothetical protein L198_07548 [Cryptococcus wingfieldii CBS 7118]|uniref:Metallo-beta-lactamase domain-containing protein n=1 Tax=Cryptococcus wingfieldii CBS 7118 TaxID=1295528 RepID=A0A1E3IA55_9TREE|nr:hypothetical protein L198_07548 [Cryptococcus wingfieldii CBS 7118]ODN85467.1 hypothetical protein L198_07548 [Cryptococcus wingfieldii CBS 7118]